MKLFKASHCPYNFKQFLETGLQSICPPKLQQHVISQKYRNYKGMMRNISEISDKLKSLPYSSHNPTGTLAGIMKPPLRGESQDAGLTRTGQHKLKVNAVEDFSGQRVAEPWMLQFGEVNALEKVLQTIVTPTTKGAAKHCKHCRKSGHLAGECQSKEGQEENVQQLENQESSPRG